MVTKLAILLSLVLLASPGVAAREVSRTMGLSQAIFEVLQEVQELIEDGAVDEAQARLEELQRKKLSDYALAQSWFLMGYVHYRREDFPSALAAYEKVLENDNLPLGMQQNVLKTLAQLSTVTEDYPGALSYLNRLLALGEQPQPDNYALKAQVLFQMERLDEALVALNEAIRLQAKREQPPRENWLLLKNGILYQKDDYKGMLRVIQQLVDLYPKDRYLLNMAAIHGELGDSKTQLALMEPLYERGSLGSASHKVNLASLYMLHDIPYKAAVLLEEELKSENIKATEQHLTMLAQAWLLSADTEQALKPLAEAAKLSDDGNNYISLGRTYMSLSRWKEAESSLQKALDKGDLTDRSGALVMLGMAQFNQKNFREARRSFAQAGQDPKSEKLARQWLEYLASEEKKAKLAELAAG
jgi:tetratricopeptide (TPR) repeat protein